MCSANPKPSPNPDPNQVLGPLQNIINDDRAAREKVAMQKQLHQEQAGLKSVTRKDLEIVGLAVEMDHGQLVLVKHSQVRVRVSHPNPNPNPNPNLGVVDRCVRGREVGCGLTEVRLELLPRGLRAQVPVRKKTQRSARPVESQRGPPCYPGDATRPSGRGVLSQGEACYLRARRAIAAAEGRQGCVEHGCKPGEPDVPTS